MIGELFDMPEELVHLRTTYVLKGLHHHTGLHLLTAAFLTLFSEMLSRGFTTVRDTGGASKALATAIDEGLIEGPRLFQCGKGLSQTGAGNSL